MPWKESCLMDERVNFVARLRDGETMSELCRELGISRKTGYKFLHRFESEGPCGLLNRSSRPHYLAKLTDKKIVSLVVRAKEKRPTWGAAKLRVLLKRDHPELIFPSKNTIHNILDSKGLVKRRKKRIRKHMSGTVLYESEQPNDLWCADYKGQFRLGNRQYCYPLTISDHKSRYLIACDSHDGTKGKDAFVTFKESFEEHGLPTAIRTDNGPPFASSQALHNLTKLSVWWMSLGIRIERIDPGCPQQNGRHERIHLTMKLDNIIKYPSQTLMKQQDAFDIFRADYNDKRPHESLGMECPTAHYKSSAKKYCSLPEAPSYPKSDRIHRVTKCGAIFTRQYRFFLTAALGYHFIGMYEQEDDIWSIKYMDLELGYFDKHEGTFHRSDR